MAEFVTVMSEFMRLCDSFKYCEGCPVDQAGFSCDCDHQGYSKTGAAELEHIIMTWAAEHPEPVYPLWGEWLTSIGAARRVPTGIPFQLVNGDIVDPPYEIEVNLYDHIPADIVEKLGIPPKEENP